MLAGWLADDHRWRFGKGDNKVIRWCKKKVSVQVNKIGCSVDVYKCGLHFFFSSRSSSFLRLTKNKYEDESLLRNGMMKLKVQVIYISLEKEHKTNIFEKHLRWSADFFISAAADEFGFFLSTFLQHNDVAIHQIHPEHSQETKENDLKLFVNARKIQRKSATYLPNLSYFLFLSHGTLFYFYAIKN